jgi:hypothetical protein
LRLTGLVWQSAIAAAFAAHLAFGAFASRHLAGFATAFDTRHFAAAFVWTSPLTLRKRSRTGDAEEESRCAKQDFSCHWDLL